MKFALLSLPILALTNQDYVALKTSLKSFILQNGTTNIPLYVRMSFHDLASGLGPRGCLKVQNVMSAPGNEGLSTGLEALTRHVSTNFPDLPFSLGDVISLAGKTAVELAYPCLKINWRYGRSNCDATNISNPIPMGNMTRVSQIQPFLDIYGLDQKEMAVLIAGGHGIAHATALPQNSGFGGFLLEFAKVNSGKAWLQETFGPWLFNPSSNMFLFKSHLMRLPSDLIFFPTVASASNGPFDISGKETEDYMRAFLGKDRDVFDKEFERIYAKMLEIGVGNDQLVEFKDEDVPVPVCRDEGSVSPTSSTPMVKTVTTTSSSAQLELMATKISLFAIIAFLL